MVGHEHHSSAVVVPSLGWDTAPDFTWCYCLTLIRLNRNQGLWSAPNQTPCTSKLGASPGCPLNVPSDIWAYQKGVSCTCISSVVPPLQHVAPPLRSGSGSGLCLQSTWAQLRSRSPPLPFCFANTQKTATFSRVRKPLRKNNINQTLFDMRASAVSHGRSIIHFWGAFLYIWMSKWKGENEK